MAKLTGGELLVDTLVGHGVDYIFSIIGGQMCSVYEAARIHPKMKLVTLRNEAAVPIMAGGYTAASGVPAVSMCTVGAGVVYEVAGLMDAWFSYLPVISIAPQVQSWKMKPHQENLQGCNQDEIFEPITKWNAIVYHWERIPQLVNRALREARANAPGPVHLDLPVDVLFKTGKVTPKNKNTLMPDARSTHFSGALPGPAEQVEAGVKALAAAKKPIAIIGQAMGTPHRYSQLRNLINDSGIPTLSSLTCSSAMDGSDSGYCGALALYESGESGRAILNQADLLLVIGIDPEIMDTLEALEGFSGTVVQVEVDPSAVLTSLASHLGVNADPISFLKNLEGRANSLKEWLEKVKKTGDDIARKEKIQMPELAPLIEGIAGDVSADEIIIIDGKDPARAANAFLRGVSCRSLFIMNNRDMAGPGLPFAIGARLAVTDGPVTLITDLDSLYRHPQELQTAVGLGIDLRIVVADPGEGVRLTRTEAVLRGLGCEVNALEPGQGLDGKKRPRPSAWLVQ